LSADLSHALIDRLAIPATFDDRGVVLVDNNLLGPSKML